jgi:hypothetical protein
MRLSEQMFVRVYCRVAHHSTSNHTKHYRATTDYIITRVCPVASRSTFAMRHEHTSEHGPASFQCHCAAAVLSSMCHASTAHPTLKLLKLNMHDAF